ncbi:MAG: hypothetical protein ING16_05630 [Roseomonas sp.]|nr:hypothetical protein [Roseomonas sp.]
MDETVSPLIAELRALKKRIAALLTDSRSLFHVANNPAFLGYDVQDFVNEIDDLIEDISAVSADEWRNAKDAETWLKTYITRLEYVRSQVVPQLTANPHMAPVILSTLDSLRRFVDNSFDNKKRLVEMRRATTRLRSLEASLNAIEPRTQNLDQMLARIEAADKTAEQLPTDLQTLSDASKSVAAFMNSAETDRAAIASKLSETVKTADALAAKDRDAGAVMTRLEAAYAAATSQGLAAAFDEKTKKLNRSILYWVLGLALALGFCAWKGPERVMAISGALAAADAGWPALGLQVLFAMMSIGPAIWFAWLATKQIGQRFRLSEDYAFKAAVAKAYEGFRREAINTDDDLAAKLLESALTRLDEQPLRFVEQPSHGSPVHELMNSSSVKDAAKAVPGFVQEVVALAKDRLVRGRQASANTEAPPPASGPTGA